MTRKFVKRSKFFFVWKIFFILFRFQLAVVLSFFALLMLESLQKTLQTAIVAQTFIKRFKTWNSSFWKSCNYSRTLVTWTLKGNEKQLELARVRVIGVDWKIQYAILKTNNYWFLSTSISEWCRTSLLISSQTVTWLGTFMIKRDLLLLPIKINYL